MSPRALTFEFFFSFTFILIACRTWNEEGINEKALAPSCPGKPSPRPRQGLSERHWSGFRFFISLLPLTVPGRNVLCVQKYVIKEKKANCILGKVWCLNAVASWLCHSSRKQGCLSFIEQMSQQSVQPLHILPRKTSEFTCYTVKKW